MLLLLFPSANGVIDHKQESTDDVYISGGLGPNVTAVEHTNSATWRVGTAQAQIMGSGHYDTIDSGPGVVGGNQDVSTGRSTTGSGGIPEPSIQPNVAYIIELQR